MYRILLCYTRLYNIYYFNLYLTISRFFIIYNFILKTDLSKQKNDNEENNIIHQ